jgi:Ni/Fe-hydrogenase subunit HybB-like protein
VADRLPEHRPAATPATGADRPAGALGQGEHLPSNEELETYDRRLDRTVFSAMKSLGIGYLLLVGFLSLVVLAALLTWGYQTWRGIGLGGQRRPPFWGIYISSFVFWIGISHSGTLVSAILRVLNVEWRRPLTRAAELMTVFALSIGGLFPIIHLGRSLKFYWLMPYPNERQIWPNFHSPLLWDMLAIFTYITASSLFLFLPLIPDLAAARDRISGIRRPIYRILSLGWRGTQQQWDRLHLAMRIFTIVVIPIAVSVHSIVSWDFGMTSQPGWNSTIFAPYFVIGAIYSGIAALMTVLVLVRRGLHLEDYITLKHFDRMGKVLLAVSLVWFYFFFANELTQWYSGNQTTRIIGEMMVHGQLAWLFWPMVVFCLVVPFATLWFRRVRTSMIAMLIISLVINAGMWIERFLIVVGSNLRNYLSFDWGTYSPGWPEVVICSATFAAFALLYLIFSKALPLISMWEVKEGWREDRWREEGLLEPEAELPVEGAATELPAGAGL